MVWISIRASDADRDDIEQAGDNDIPGDDISVRGAPVWSEDQEISSSLDGTTGGILRISFTQLDEQKSISLTKGN